MKQEVLVEALRVERTDWGWWLTCSDMNLNPKSSLMSSYVSPRSGLKGLPVLSHWEATAETAKAATDCILSRDWGWREAL